MQGGFLSRNMVAAGGTGAVLCGLLFLGQTGAPLRLLLINLVTVGVGVALVAIVRLLPPLPRQARGPALVAAALALIATALFGVSSEGASRWVLAGGLALQPSLILVPLLLLAHVARPDRWSGFAVALAALAMALQPDRSVAAAILAVTLVDAAFRRSPAASGLAAAALGAFAVTLLRPDRLPAVPHVDQLLWTSFSAEPLAVTALWAGTLLLFLPALLLWRGGGRPQAAAFAALWSTLVLSALVANYPTPLVGYGASSILGYLLAALALPALADRPGSRAVGADVAADPAHDRAPPSWRARPSTL